MVIPKLDESKYNKTNTKEEFNKFLDELQLRFHDNDITSCFISNKMVPGGTGTLYILIKGNAELSEQKLKDFLLLKNFAMINGYAIKAKKDMTEEELKNVYDLYTEINGFNQNVIVYPVERDKNVDERVVMTKEALLKIKLDATRLLQNIDSALENIDSIKTMEDAKEFAKNHEIEDGLEYIDIDI